MMLYQLEKMDAASRTFARRAVLSAAFLAAIGSAFGLTFGVAEGMVRGLELWLVASCLLFSIGVLAAYLVLPPRHFRGIALAAVLYYTLYLSAGLLIAIHRGDNNLNALVYLFWFFPLLAFNILMRTSRVGAPLHLLILVLPILLLGGSASQILAVFPAEAQGVLAVFCLAYLCFGMILSTLSQYREAFIAERERAETLLGASQILESISDCFLSVDRTLRLSFANGAARAELGLPAAADGGGEHRPLGELAPHLFTGRIAEALDRALKSTDTSHFEAESAGGERSYEFRCFPRPDGLSVYFRNITEAVAVRSELRRSEALLRIASEMARIGGWQADLRSGLVFLSEEVLAVFRRPGGRRVFSTEESLDMYLPESRGRIRQLLARCTRTGRSFDEEAQVHDGVGGSLWVRVMGKAVRDPDGRLIGIEGAVQDITARKRAESRLQEQANLLDKAQDAIVVLNLDRTVRFWNRSAERLYGWSSDEAVGAGFDMLLRHDAELFGNALERLQTRGEWSGELAEQRKDGTRVTTEAHWTLVRDDAGRPESILAIQTDITERLAMERQLRQSQRLQAVGQLTGGVAHDFNNLLTVILGNSDLLVDGLQDRPRLRHLATMVHAASEKATALTQRLLAFARQQALEPRPTDLAALVDGMRGLLDRTLGEDVDIRLALEGESCVALIDPDQLEAALLNLAINARDAMPGGGCLTIELANVVLDQAYADWNEEVTPGAYVMVAVSDNGTGMTPDVAAQAFEPFFTTKDVGKGSGLGLSMVFGFVKQSQGHVQVYSEPGQGTTVRLYLPRALSAAEASPQIPSGGLVGGNERVLLVEDDDMVRRHVTGQLQTLGYSVVGAAAGPEALALLDRGEQVDLLFTDLVMPGGMNGRELAEAVASRQPGMPVLFTTGYAEHAILNQGQLTVGVSLLNKPYRLQDLALRLRQVFQEATGASASAADRSEGGPAPAPDGGGK